MRGAERHEVLVFQEKIQVKTKIKFKFNLIEQIYIILIKDDKFTNHTKTRYLFDIYFLKIILFSYPWELKF